MGFPSTATVSEGPARSPSLATFPLTVIRPAAIQTSISRRDPRPAAASSFCSRSAVGAGGRLLLLFRFPDSGLGARRHHGQLEGLGDLFQRRQLFERAQPEVVEEPGGGGV